MSGLPDDAAKTAINDQALAWFVRLNSGDATESEQDSFALWLAGDARHQQEYERLARVWSDLDRIPDPRAGRRASTSVSRRQIVLGGTAALGVAALAGVASVSNLPSVLAGDIRTGTGERKTVTAVDGSRIDLDAGTTLAVEFTPTRRLIRLKEGRARFTVARDAARPFEVVCADGAVRALGTAFVVHRRSDDVAVAVQESAVSVTVPANAAGAQQVQLVAGQRVAYGAFGLGAVEIMNADTETAWLRGKLVFQDRRLRDVLADLERYRSGRIVIWDEALLNLRVDGIFDMSNPDSALDAMVRTLPVRATHLTRYLVILRQA